MFKKIPGLRKTEPKDPVLSESAGTDTGLPDPAQIEKVRKFIAAAELQEQALVDDRGAVYAVKGVKPMFLASVRNMLETDAGKPEIEFLSPFDFRRRLNAAGIQVKSGAEKTRSVRHDNLAVDNVLGRAIDERASDFYLDVRKLEDRTILSFRTYGIVKEVEEFTSGAGQEIARGLFSKAINSSWEELDPCDCAFSHYYKGRLYRVRTNSLPEIRGSSLSCRIRDPNFVLPLETAGYSPGQKHLIERICRSPGGLILVTGETNSGKVHDSGQSLMKDSPRGQRMIEIADPVEVEFENVTHCEIDHKRANPEEFFNNLLSSTVRQNPDALVLGEIRDPETAKAAQSMAIQGKRVFSTLHTQSCIAAIPRMINLGIDGHLLTLPEFCAGIVNQNLVPLVCPDCCLREPANSDLKERYRRLLRGRGTVRQPRGVRRVQPEMRERDRWTDPCRRGPAPRPRPQGSPSNHRVWRAVAPRDLHEGRIQNAVQTATCPGQGPVGPHRSGTDRGDHRGMAAYRRYPGEGSLCLGISTAVSSGIFRLSAGDRHMFYVLIAAQMEAGFVCSKACETLQSMDGLPKGIIEISKAGAQAEREGRSAVEGMTETDLLPQDEAAALRIAEMNRMLVTALHNLVERNDGAKGFISKVVTPNLYFLVILVILLMFVFNGTVFFSNMGLDGAGNPLFELSLFLRTWLPWIIASLGGVIVLVIWGMHRWTGVHRRFLGPFDQIARLQYGVRFCDLAEMMSSNGAIGTLILEQVEKLYARSRYLHYHASRARRRIEEGGLQLEIALAQGMLLPKHAALLEGLVPGGTQEKYEAGYRAIGVLQRQMLQRKFSHMDRLTKILLLGLVVYLFLQMADGIYELFSSFQQYR